MGIGAEIGHVVDGDHVQILPMPLKHGPQRQTADPSEAIDADSGNHESALGNPLGLFLKAQYTCEFGAKFLGAAAVAGSRSRLRQEPELIRVVKVFFL